jgi:hypothetical protein
MKYKINNKIINLLLVLISIITAILLSELFLRLAKIEYPIFQQHDHETGFSLRPNASANWSKEGKAFVKINTDGLRDFEHSYSKGKNTLRIAVLGDSFAEARSVDLEKTFWYLMQKNLSNCKNIGKNIEVINFGVTEYGTGQQYLILKNKVWKYNPDIILLAFFSAGNVSANIKELSRKKYRPFFNLKNNELIIDNSFRETKPYKILSSSYGKFFLKLTNYSRVAQLFKEFYVKSYFKKQQHTANNKSKEEKLNKRLSKDESFNPKNKEWINAWNVTEKIITEINKEVTQNRRKFILATLSVPFQVHPEKLYRDNFIKKHSIEDMFYPEKRLAKLGKQNNFDVISLAEDMQKYAIKHKIFFHGFKNSILGDGHLNEDGHNISSELLSSKICKTYN